VAGPHVKAPRIVQYAVRPANERETLQRGFSPTLDFTLQMTAGEWELWIKVAEGRSFTQLVRLSPGGTGEPVVLRVP
jgi:hypothetical protein